MNGVSPSKIRVMVVDDAVVIRRLVSDLVESDPELELAGWASNGKIALAKIEQINPDCITLDLEMPEMDGLQTLVEIRKTHPKLPVIMFSTLTERGGAKTLEALAHGATDYVTKPANVGSVMECMDRLRHDLIPKIKAYSRSRYAAAVPVTERAANSTRLQRKEPEILCIASSTGGPNALAEVIPALPGDLPVPVVIVQHMPPVFTEQFALRLDKLSPLHVEEAKDGSLVQPGFVYLAPGGKHMEVQVQSTGKFLRLHEEPPENSCRPAADVLFRSVARAYGAAVLGVVLTGMGQDGCRGARSIAEAGGRVIVQDQATSVVWGMPGAVAEAGLADRILPLSAIAGEIQLRLARKVRLPRAI